MPHIAQRRGGFEGGSALPTCRRRLCHGGLAGRTRPSMRAATDTEVRAHTCARVRGGAGGANSA